MGLAVVGGLSVGTLLTLFVIPAVYTVLAGAHRPIVDDVALSGDGASDHVPAIEPVTTAAGTDV